MTEVLNGALRTIWGLEDDFNRNAFDDIIIDSEQQNRALCNKFISKFNLLFVVTLVMFKKKNEKKNQVFDLLSGQKNKEEFGYP